jgi:lipopolysaccharide biosynthesis protein
LYVYTFREHPWETIKNETKMPIENPARLVAFYLPQFHPTSYNDEWWGKGFTEWTNVVKAKPRFPGHYQPHLPADLGFYDLRLPETREAQATLARDYGIHGFCYYHYWFSGRRLLEQPLDAVLESGKPDFPFCICWANGSWTRAWDGLSRKILLEQKYSQEDDLAHIHHLIPFMRDQRYIRVDRKPLLLIYCVEWLPSPEATAELWRREVSRAGLGELFLMNVQSPDVREHMQPQTIGFDASVRFQPDIRGLSAPNKFVAATRVLKSPLRNDRIFSYGRVYQHWKDHPITAYRHFECVTPMWDNTARRSRQAWMIRDPDPELYEKWLREAVQRSEPDLDGTKWVFINAWNEWAEGCHLEPCQRWGRAYLEATKRALE